MILSIWDTAWYLQTIFHAKTQPVLNFKKVTTSEKKPYRYAPERDSWRDAVCDARQSRTD